MAPPFGSVLFEGTLVGWLLTGQTNTLLGVPGKKTGDGMLMRLPALWALLVKSGAGLRKVELRLPDITHLGPPDISPKIDYRKKNRVPVF